MHICRAALRREPRILISAGALTELLIVATGRGRAHQVHQLLADADPEIVPVPAVSARSCAAAYARRGEGGHPARLNLADGFSSVLAQERGAPLLYVGADFAQTDVASALPGAALSDPPS